MTTWHGYIEMENLALTGPQKATLISSLRQLGINDDPQPCHRNHWRVRLDNDAVIFEAAFDDTHLTVSALRNRIANIFSVPVAQVTAAATSTGYGPVVTLTYASTARLRFVLFGDVGATWESSRTACLAYLAANLAAWESQAA